MKKEEFEVKYKSLEIKHGELEKRAERLSLMRLLSFVFAAGGFGYAVFEKEWFGLLAGIVFLFVFFYMVRVYNAVEEEKIYTHNASLTVKCYIDRFGSLWHESGDKGEDLMPDDDRLSYTVDLDIVGKASLFQYLCVAGTNKGRRALAASLMNSSPEVAEIAAKQEAVRELSDKEEFCFHIQTLANILKSEGKGDSFDDMGSFTEKVGNWQSRVLIINVITAVTIICGLFALFSSFYATKIIFGVSLSLQLALAMLTFARHGGEFAPLRRFNSNLTAYQKIFEAVENEEFSSTLLKDIKNGIMDKASATKGIKRLNLISEYISLRYNIFGFIFLGSLFMWDFRCSHMLNEWKLQYGTYMNRWFESVGSLESLISLSVICRVKDNWCFPRIEEDSNPHITMEKGGHPLICEGDSVCNDFTTKSRTIVVTGSNMSGKTTFMRTVGCNLILAYAGGPVCAKNMTASCMRIFTSMRIQDDVSMGISTFYAEILRIRSMVEYLDCRKPMIALIDEIFKGTNSADRIIGAKEAVKKLTRPWVITIVTTHDFELCDLEYEEGIRAINYHFSEYYRDDKIFFDYTIKEGRCKTTNAQHLMRMAGLIS